MTSSPMPIQQDLRVEDALHTAVTHHRAGRMQEAEALYRSILQAHPEHPDANHNLGVLAVQMQQPAPSLAFFKSALKANPASEQYWVSYIDALMLAGEPDIARRMLELGRSHGMHGERLDALAARLSASADAGPRESDQKKEDPTGKPARTGSAKAPPKKEVDTLTALFNQGRYPETESLARSFTDSYPGYGFGWKLLAVVLRQQGRPAEALPVAENAAALLPADAESHANLGNVLKDLGKFEAAEASYRRALQIKPDYAEAYSNFGSMMRARNRLDEAETYLKKAVESKPSLAAAHSNLGNILFDRGRFDAAVSSFARAVALKPDFAEAYYHLGNALTVMGEVPAEVRHLVTGATPLEAAMSCYRRALQIRPGLADVHYAVSLLHLHMGELEKGWEGYEYRWTKALNPSADRNFPYPRWDGSSLEGKRILLWGEQGVGDQLLWASMFQEIIDQADHCVIECAPKLVPLLGQSFPKAAVVPARTPRHPATLQGFDFQCAMGSLARFLRPGLASYPARNRYIVADPARVEYWKARLASLGEGPKVGVSWRSLNASGDRNLNYTTLDEWGPVFAAPGVHFINLQYDECTAELDAARRQFGVPIHVYPEVDLLNDLAETAALTQALDYVIASFTSVYPMAAGVGVPTCTMYSWSVGWATLGGKSIPWCPEMQCFTRKWNEPWDEVMQQVAREIRALAPGFRSPS